MEAKSTETTQPNGVGLPTLSIVVPSKNRPVEIARLLATIAARCSVPDEIVVVDQSTQPYALDPKIAHLYRPDLRGLTAARNVGAAAAHGDIVLFMDDDVEVAGDCVAIMRKLFADDPQVVGAQADIQDERDDPATRRMHYLRERIFERGFFDSHTYRIGTTNRMRRLTGSVMAFRRSLLLAEPFDEHFVGYSLGEDWEYSIRALRHGKLWFAPGATVIHHASPTNRFDRRRQLVARWENHRYIYRKLADRRRIANIAAFFWWSAGETLTWLKYGYGVPWLQREGNRE